MSLYPYKITQYQAVLISPTISDTLPLISTGEQYSSGALDQLVLTREYCTLKKWLQLIKTTDAKIFFHKAKKQEKL